MNEVAKKAEHGENEPNRNPNSNQQQQLKNPRDEMMNANCDTNLTVQRRATCWQLQPGSYCGGGDCSSVITD
ncbi:hypothetical protein P8452_10930 [Trifolium repens]|jgi:hypothetical protein|nr:hypothetical protein P8452_10920 [Trifolium repens]WJX21499.1 hypothetical protein P8452_10930 [Trifolium repens]